MSLNKNDVIRPVICVVAGPNGSGRKTLEHTETVSIQDFSFLKSCNLTYTPTFHKKSLVQIV